MSRVIVILIALSLIISGCTSGSNKEQKIVLASAFELGEKYLAELNYEQALEQFLAAIESEPANPQGYISAADAYKALDKNDESVKILQRGYDAISSDEIKNLIDSSKYETNDIVAPSSEVKTSDEQSEQMTAPKEENTEKEYPQFPQPMEGYPKTERKDIDFEGATYCIYEYNEFGNVIKATAYDSEDIVRSIHEIFYDKYQNKVRTTSKYIDYDNDMITKREVFLDLSGREIKIIHGDETTRICTDTYDYTNSNEVKVTLFSAEYEDAGVFYQSYNETIVCDLQFADSKVIVFDLSYNTEGLEWVILNEASFDGGLSFDKEYTFVK